MKRNWDAIREILLRLEEAMPGEPPFSEDRASEAAYQLDLLIEAGLVTGPAAKASGPGSPPFAAMRLTWQGHEFLDVIRSDMVWQRTKRSFAASGLAMTLDLIRTVAANIAASMLKSPMSG
jgi:hypothetical protein